MYQHSIFKMSNIILYCLLYYCYQSLVDLKYAIYDEEIIQIDQIRDNGLIFSKYLSFN